MSTPRGHVIDDHRVDAHAVLQRAQLLEALALLQRRLRQADETVERAAAIGVDADMVIERALAIGRGGAGEIQRPQPARRDLAADQLDDAGRGLLLVIGDQADERGDVDRRIGERQDRSRDRDGFERRKIALNVDDDIVQPVRVEDVGRLLDAVRARGMRFAGHHRASARRFDGRADVRRNRSRPRRGRCRPPRPGARPARSSARHGCRPAACRAGASPSCGRGSGSAGLTSGSRLGGDGIARCGAPPAMGGVNKSQSGACLYELQRSAQSG